MPCARHLAVSQIKNLAFAALAIPNRIRTRIDDRLFLVLRWFSR